MAKASMFAEVTITGTYKNLARATKGATKQIASLATTSKKVANTMKAAFAGVAAALLTGFISEMVRGAEAARQADQRIDRIAKRIGVFGKGLPSVTARLKEYADTVEISTGVTAEEVKAAQAKILTYSAVAKSAKKLGGIFDRTTMAAIDLAAAGFGSVSGNADTLGKALANPVKGLAALTKQGFVYTDQQKRQFAVWVRQGKLYKAQNFILKDIESQVQGVAAASGLASVKIANALGQIGDEIGNALLPILDELVAFFKSSEGKKAITDFTDKIRELGAWFGSAEGKEALQGWMTDLKNLITLAGEFLGLVTDVKNLFTPATNKTRDGLATDFSKGEMFAPTTGAELANRLSGNKIPQSKVNYPIKPTLPAPVVTQYITINGVVSGNEIVKALRGQASLKGRTIAGLLGP